MHAAQVLDIFHYPQRSEGWIGCLPHADPGLVTLVTADAEGLQVQQGARWVDAGAPAAWVAIVGAEWAKAASLGVVPPVSCCIHRVSCAAHAARTSAAFEVRLDPARRALLARNLGGRRWMAWPMGWWPCGSGEPRKRCAMGSMSMCGP